MCGIFGFYETKNGRSRTEMEAVGAALARALSHRGPDDGGLWQDPDAPLLLGHRRLSIIDLSPEGHQPMESHGGRYLISYNGEIYNFQALAAALKAEGASFHGRSDTEVMLAAFERWGVNHALQKLSGMFAFALWDRREKTLHLVRDRLGKKPLYVGRCGDTVLFSSELKAFHAHPAFDAAISREALTLYMRYGCVPAPFTIYEGIYQIPAGCRMALNEDTLRSGDLFALIESYWNHAQIVEESRLQMHDVSDAQAIDEFESLLSACVKDRMVSDVPLGAFLSGGIDSSAVVALMQKHAPQPVKTFSIGFHESGFDEAAYASKVAQHLGTDHHELYVSAADALAVVPELATIYDEPFADVSQIPTLLVSRFARQLVTVALSGDGGDEMLGGYVRHYTLPRLWGACGAMPPFMRRALAGGIRSVGPATWNALVPFRPQFGARLYKAANLLAAADAEDAYVSVTSQWQNPETIVRGGREPMIPLRDPAHQPQGLNFAERMMYGDALSYLPNDVLVKVDRATMAAGLEARAPLLDTRLFEYCWSLPLRFKIRDGKGKWLLRKMLARHIPEKLFVRPKQGFAVPIGDWLRGPLRPWAEDLLAGERLEQDGYFNAAPIRAAWRDHLSGRGGNDHALWTVLMFQSWLGRWR